MERLIYFLTFTGYIPETREDRRGSGLCGWIHPSCPGSKSGYTFGDTWKSTVICCLCVSARHTKR